ncbi:MAG TPA: hypothetical protein VMY88_02280 [Acidimicrobiales bacterium]|nr:hypothetical protein [Acidimicrobiales bacterium]
MRRLALLLVAAVTVVITGCSSGGDDPTGKLTAEGQTEISVSGGGWRPVTGTVQLESGQEVRVIDGTATIGFGDDRQVSLRKGTQVRLTKAGDEDRPTLLAGELLVEATNSALKVSAGDSDVEVDGGVARLSRGLTVVVGTYSGTSTVTSAGRQLAVPALRQANVPAVGLVPARPSPLSYKAGDPWDERYLGDAIQLGDELAARSRGFTAQRRPGEEVNAGFYRQLIPALSEQADFDANFVGPNRAAGETLVGLAITAEGTKGSFADRLQRVFGFHDEGAAWGVVALDHGVTRVRILSAVDQALGRGPALFAEAPVTPSPPTTGSSQSLALPAEIPELDPSPSPPAPEESPVSTVPLPSAGPLRTGVPAVDGTVNSLVDVLSGLLGALGR